MKNEIKILYAYKNDKMNMDVAYESKMDLSFPTTVKEIVFFVKHFLQKLNFIPNERLNEYINLLDDDEFCPEKEIYGDDNDGLDVYNQLLESSDKDIKKIIEDENSLNSFKEQLNNNKELLKEVFEIFLRDTLE